MRQLVIGTAGHIDHGKSALVRALTGTDPDRLKEERRRGITIELGFADLDLGGDRVLSFVDVPGHERFVRHMVAGATGIDAVLLVVAADQGVQPQTIEHLEICSLLGLRRGVVALTKSDLADRELLEVVEMETKELLAGTFLGDAPVVEVSAETGAGLETLKATLGELLDATQPRAADGVARLPVDRSFVMKGFGAVVTGTLVAGTLSEGQIVEVVPGGKKGRIRGLQVHHHKASEVVAGSRTAVNVQGLDCADVPRGSTLVEPGGLSGTVRAWARVRLLDTAPKGLRNGGPVHFHQGTCERRANLRVFGHSADGQIEVELRFDEPTLMVPGDRFVLRRPAPVNTVGGGLVLDAHPPRLTRPTPDWFAEDALAPQPAVELRLGRAGEAGCDPARLARSMGWSRTRLEQVLEDWSRGEPPVRAGGVLISGPLWTGVLARTHERIRQFHDDRPLDAGMSREALRVAVCREMPQEVWRELLEVARRGGGIRLDAEKVALAEHRVELGDDDLEMARRIETQFGDGGLEPPNLDQVLNDAELARSRPIVEWMIGQGKLQRIQDGRLFHAAALDDLRRKVREYGRSSPTIDVAGFKQLTGVTRKNAIPLLEQLDAERATRRKGNLREILV